MTTYFQVLAVALSATMCFATIYNCAELSTIGRSSYRYHRIRRKTYTLFLLTFFLCPALLIWAL